jgi:hypothetical protein
VRFIIGLLVGSVVGATGTVFYANSEKMFALATEWRIATHPEPGTKAIEEPSDLSAPRRGGDNEPRGETKTSSTGSPRIARPQYSRWFSAYIATPSGTQSTPLIDREPTPPTGRDGRVGDTFDALNSAAPHPRPSPFKTKLFENQ